MLFWIFVIALVIGIACIILGHWMWDHTKYDTDWLKFTGVIIVVIAAIALVFSLGIIACSYIGIDAQVAENQQIYDSLTYQLENNLYDNDNDLGKKELYNQIQDWNADLAYYKAVQDDFWVGIYVPDVFDQFKFIELSSGDAYVELEYGS